MQTRDVAKCKRSNGKGDHTLGAKPLSNAHSTCLLLKHRVMHLVHDIMYHII